MRDIGKNIRSLRQKANLTQEELAEELFVTRQTVSNYENGKTRPDVDMIVKISEVLRTDANAVIYGLPVCEDRKRVYRRMIILSTAAVLAGAFIILLNKWAVDYRSRTFILFPYSIAKLFLNPVAYAAAGWWLMDTLSVFVQFKRLSNTVAKRIRTGVFCLLVFLLVVMVPNLIFQLIADHHAISTGSVNMFFPYIPVFSEIESLVIISTLKYTPVYAMFGVILYILGFPQKKDHP